jgi:hypothetical protein
MPLAVRRLLNWRPMTRNSASERRVLTAFYEANVLYPSELRNLLMHLALTGLFRARWSAAVHEEWICALLRRRSD